MRDLKGLLKIALPFGDLTGGAYRRETTIPPSTYSNINNQATVGDVMHSINSNFNNINPMVRRDALNRIVGTGLPVTDSADKLLYAMKGGIIGDTVAHSLGFGNFGTNMMRLGGMHLGQKFHNDMMSGKKFDWRSI